MVHRSRSSRWRSLAVSAAAFLAAAAAGAAPFSDIYVLGDSLSDQGNLLRATEALTGGPSTAWPARDHYFDGRFSNGEVYSGLLAQRLGLSLTPSSTGGNNFAYGGARTDANIVERPSTPGGGFAKGAYPWSLNLERQAFSDRSVVDPQALYVVFFGSNDMADLIGPTLNGGFASTQAQSDAVVQGVMNVIDAYRAAGARYVLVPNVPDLGVVPSVTSRNPPGSTIVSSTATALSQRYNATLASRLQQVTDLQIISFDTFQLVRDLHDNPARYGLGNATQPCYSGFVYPDASATECADPASHVYWDTEHPTTVTHALIADRMLAAVDAALVPEPGSAPLLLAALGALALTLRRRAGGAACAGAAVAA